MHIKFYFKNIIYFENMFLNGLKHCSEYLRALGICLNAFGAQLIEL
jgi:hypothetical protein